MGAITVLGLYKQFHDRWFLEETFEPLLRWNRWWAQHRDMEGYLAWGSDRQTRSQRTSDDGSRGNRAGRDLRIGTGQQPDVRRRRLTTRRRICWSIADVGLMSMYIADCDALAEIADALGEAD